MFPQACAYLSASSSLRAADADPECASRSASHMPRSTQMWRFAAASISRRMTGKYWSTRALHSVTMTGSAPIALLTVATAEVGPAMRLVPAEIPRCLDNDLATAQWPGTTSFRSTTVHISAPFSDCRQREGSYRCQRYPGSHQGRVTSRHGHSLGHCPCQTANNRAW
jgi:hypothetical protein